MDMVVAVVGFIVTTMVVVVRFSSGYGRGSDFGFLIS